MQRKTLQLFQRHTFWLSLLLHLLLFSSLSVVLTFKHPPQAQPLIVPSYSYHEDASPPARLLSSKSQPDKQQPALPKQTGMPLSETKSTSNTSQATTSSNNTQAIHLIGNKKLDKPLIKLLGKALTARLFYPKIAQDFRLHGTVTISFVIHPDGKITDAELLKTSGTEVLDNAALASVRAMSPVKNVNVYLSEPKYMVFGIIFN